MWLGDVMRRLKPVDRNLPALPRDIDAAWEAVAAYCGLSDWNLAEQIASQYGLRCEPLPAALSDEALEWARLPLARRYGAVLLRRAEGYMVVAVANPVAPDMIDRLSFVGDQPIEIVVAPPDAIRRLSESREAEGREGEASQGEPEEVPPEARGGEFHLEDKKADGAVVRLCNLMLRHAIGHRASDIHVQPMSNGGIVRMRIDGMLRIAGRLPLSVTHRLISRVKAVAGMNPTDHMRPQDGHAVAVDAARTLDLRISTLPVKGGEKLVVRVLGGHSVIRLSDLDLPEIERRQVQNLIDANMGAVLVAGPTGSGKTTTLYSVLHEKNTPEVNIVTVEDPVEMRMPRLAQTEVNAKAGLDFAAALRSVVRQDPDIILIGEIRDADTAAIAMQAAITGHLVFASIHANDAVSVLPRLTELGVNPDLAGEAVRGIMSQRLIREVCKECARPAHAPWTPAENWLRTHGGLASSMRAVGCPACAGTGYKGRLSILQVLTITPGLAQLLDHGAPLSQVREFARGQGMRFLSESALDRIRRGQTTVQEVLRVMGSDFWRDMGVVFGAALSMEQTQTNEPDTARIERGAVLLVAKNEAWRSKLTGWLHELGWPVVAACDEQEVRKAMAHEADFALGVIDVEQVDDQRAEVLMALRTSLGGAAVPLLVFEEGSTGRFAHLFGEQAYARLVQRPTGADVLRQQIEGMFK